MTILSKIVILGLASTTLAYVRPSDWKNTYKQLFNKEVTAELLAAIDAEINDFEADGGEVLGEALDVDFEEAEEDVEENFLEGALADGGQKARGGKKKKGGKRKKKRGRKPKKPEGEKYEYSVQSDDHSVPADEPTKPLKGKKQKVAIKVLTAIASEPCMENCDQYCSFGKVEMNAQHEPCRKCARQECLTEIKAVFGGRPGKGKGKKGGKGGKRRPRKDHDDGDDDEAKRPEGGKGKRKRKNRRKGKGGDDDEE